jgi:hypothetical protein
MLFLKAAMAQASAAEADDISPDTLAWAVPAFLDDEADEHADRLGSNRNELWTSFGPTNCGLYRAAAHVQLSEGAGTLSVLGTGGAEGRLRALAERCGLPG